jgi:hypothetical protein
MLNWITKRISIEIKKKKSFIKFCATVSTKGEKAIKHYWMDFYFSVHGVTKLIGYWFYFIWFKLTRNFDFIRRIKDLNELDVFFWRKTLPYQTHAIIFVKAKPHSVHTHIHPHYIKDE